MHAKGRNRGQTAGPLMGVIIFAVLLMVLVKVFSSTENAIALSSSTSEAAYAKGNASNNTWSSIQLSSVGPIIMGAVVVLGLIGILSRGR